MVPVTIPMCFSVSAASCGVARGIMPGSLNAVRSSVAITNINNKHATTGTAAVNRGINRRQLETQHLDIPVLILYIRHTVTRLVHKH